MDNNTINEVLNSASLAGLSSAEIANVVLERTTKWYQRPAVVFSILCVVMLIIALVVYMLATKKNPITTAASNVTSSIRTTIANSQAKQTANAASKANQEVAKAEARLAEAQSKLNATMQATGGGPPSAPAKAAQDALARAQQNAAQAQKRAQEAAAKAQEAERKRAELEAKKAAERKAKAEAEARRAAERKAAEAKKAAERKAKAEAEARKKAEREAKKRAEAEAKQKQQQKPSPAARPPPAAPGPAGNWLAGMNIERKEMPAVVTYQGKTALHVQYKAGGRGPKGSNTNIEFIPRGIFPAEQARVRFSIWFADNFPWDKAPGHKVAGKLGGFRIGTGSASGANYSKTGATYRVVFDDGGVANGYLYPQIAKDSRGNRNIGWDLADQGEGLKKVSGISSGIHVWGNEFKLYRGRWNNFEMFIKLNTPGKKDGIMELTVNGVSRRITDVRYRNDNAKINSFHLQPFFGGSTVEFAPKSNTSAWFADYVFTSA